MHIINFTLCSRHPFICEKHLICDWVWIAICRFPLPPSKNLTDVKIPVPLQPPWTTFYPPVQVFPQNPLLTICLPPKFLLHRYCTRKKKWNNCKNIILCLYVSKIKVLFINVPEVLTSVKIAFRWHFIRNAHNILGGNHIGFDVFGLKKSVLM